MQKHPAYAGDIQNLNQAEQQPDAAIPLTLPLLWQCLTWHDLCGTSYLPLKSLFCSFFHAKCRISVQNLTKDLLEIPFLTSSFIWLTGGNFCYKHCLLLNVNMIKNCLYSNISWYLSQYLVNKLQSHSSASTWTSKEQLSLQHKCAINSCSKSKLTGELVEKAFASKSNHQPAPLPCRSWASGIAFRIGSIIVQLESTCKSK